MEESMTIKQVAEELAGFGAPVWISLLVAVGIYILEIILLKKGIIFSSGIKKMERAKELGQTVTAVRVSCRYKDRGNDTGIQDRLFIAVYRYEYRGRVYKKQITSTSGMPPVTIPLYFLPGSSKPLCEYDRKANWLIPLFYILPLAAAVAVYGLIA